MRQLYLRLALIGLLASASEPVFAQLGTTLTDTCKSLSVDVPIVKDAAGVANKCHVGMGSMLCACMVSAVQRKLMADFELWKKGIAGSSCSSPNWNSGVGYEKELLGLVSIMEPRAGEYGRLVRDAESKLMFDQMFSPVESSMRSAAEVTLSVGDEALRVGCLDIADAQYRHALSTYSIANYMQRAQVGIDDVRVRRSAIMCRLFGYC
jgi:hypothetical protein